MKRIELWVWDPLCKGSRGGRQRHSAELRNSDGTEMSSDTVQREKNKIKKERQTMGGEPTVLFPLGNVLGRADTLPDHIIPLCLPAWSTASCERRPSTTPWHQFLLKTTFFFFLTIRKLSRCGGHWHKWELLWPTSESAPLSRKPPFLTFTQSSVVHSADSHFGSHKKKRVTQNKQLVFAVNQYSRCRYYIVS